MGQLIDFRNYGVQAALRKMKTGQMPAMMAFDGAACPPREGRQVPGYNPIPCDVSPKCKWISFALNNAAVAASATVTLTVTPNVTMCLQRIVVTTQGSAGFLLQNLNINNKPQWVQNNQFHSASFQGTTDDNTELPGDCILPGSTVSVQVTNLDGAAAQGIFIRLSGPSGE